MTILITLISFIEFFGASKLYNIALYIKEIKKRNLDKLTLILMRISKLRMSI